MPGLDGKSAFEVNCYRDPVKGVVLHLRRFVLGEDGKVTTDSQEDKVVVLDKPPAGKPALGQDSLLLPLSNGDVARFRLPPEPGLQVNGDRAGG